MGEDNQEKKHHSGFPLLIVNTFHISCDFELLRQLTVDPVTS